MVVRRVAITVPGWNALEPRASVLLVSADQEFSGVAVRVLRRAWIAAETAPHGGHAFLACMRQRFDLILIDTESIERSDQFVGGLLRHCAGARVAPLGARPRCAEELLERVDALLPVPQPK
ncbi:MAG TPA: hypothetical protein VL484_08900 [Vicinamibacterales bacterium]|nr:hypothetical protein [Vicinamibacterales bacterium]